MESPQSTGTIFNTDVDNLTSHFPHSEWRPGQMNCIKFICNAFNNGSKFALIEAPTGSGKSAIGLTMANMASSATYITVQKILQDQIESSYRHNSDLVSLKGKNNYKCTFYEIHGHKASSIAPHELRQLIENPPNCDKGFCRTKSSADKHKCNPCVTNGTCEYINKYQQAKSSHIAVLNLHNFIRHSSAFSRELLVLDEAHSLERELLSHISVTINDSILAKYNIQLPEYDDPYRYLDFFLDNHIPDKLGVLASQAELDQDFSLSDELSDQVDRCNRFIQAMQGGELWVCEFNQREHYRSVTIKPVYVNNYADKYIFSKFDKVLLMSATILNPHIYLNSLGIGKTECKSYSMRNRFPAENRPIVIRPAAKMTGGKEAAKEWLPKLANSVDTILREHPGERGIIHTHNFMIARYIMDNCQAQNRLMFQEHFDSKNTMLEIHATKPGSVIVAPALHEGLDLKNELSRFQILCKIPWANFYEDKQLEARVKDRGGDDYYRWLTALKLIQSCGRSIRNEKDWAVTYIIDEGIYSFLNQASLMLPTWFQESIIEYLEWVKMRKDWLQKMKKQEII